MMKRIPLAIITITFLMLSCASQTGREMPIDLPDDTTVSPIDKDIDTTPRGPASDTAMGIRPRVDSVLLPDDEKY